MRLKIMIARYCVFVHVSYYSILRVDGIHSVTGAENFQMGSTRKVSCTKYLMSKRLGTVFQYQLLYHTHIRMKQKTHANILCSYIGTIYVGFKAYMYKKKQKLKYTLKYYLYEFFCALPKGCNAQRVFYSNAWRCPTPSGLKSVCSKLLPKNCWHHQLVILQLQHKIMRVISKTTRKHQLHHTTQKFIKSQQYYHHNMIMC